MLSCGKWAWHRVTWDWVGADAPPRGREVPRRRSAPCKYTSSLDTQAEMKMEFPVADDASASVTCRAADGTPIHYGNILALARRGLLPQQQHDSMMHNDENQEQNEQDDEMDEAQALAAAQALVALVSDKSASDDDSKSTDGSTSTAEASLTERA